MTRFVLRRLGVFAVTVVLASLATFGALYVAPGSPVDFLLGSRPATAEQRAALSAQLHLDQPFLERYLSWLGGLLHADFGTSIQQGQPVADLLKAALPTTVLLVGLTFVLTVVVGLTLGSVAALRSRRTDDGIGALMNVSIATPPFVASVMLISLFAVRLGWFPVFGQGTGLVDRLQHLVLPAVALTIGWWPVVGSVSRTSMREEMGREHVETAISRGLPRGRVLRRHVLRNALVPIITASGLALAGLVAGTAIIESTFELNGLGGLLVRSVTQKDFAVAQAVAMIMVTVFALTNLLVDLVGAVLDPPGASGVVRVTTASVDVSRRRLTARSLRIEGLDLVGHLALLGVLLFAVLAVVGPLLAPHDPDAVDLSKAFWGPDGSHWLGYDSQGRDIMSRLLVGARSSFLGPLGIVLLASTLGLLVAIVAAWRGGWVDAALAGLLDVSMSFPGLLLAVMAVAVFGSGATSVVIALGLAYAPYIARIVRASALTEIRKDYVDTLRVQGFSGTSICGRHVVPNLLPITTGQSALTLAWATVDLAGLSFLGFGVQPPTADWGVMVSAGQAGVLAGYPAESLASGTCLILAICSFSLLGDRLLRRAEEVAA